jgi:phage terminase large subunit
MAAVDAALVVIPYSPRPLQRVLHHALDNYRWAVAVCHRRFGKTVLAINQLQKRAVTCEQPRGRYAYIAPTYRQGKAIAWDYMKHYAAPIPGIAINESELRIDYPNGAQVRIYGADNPDALRGIYLDGVVLDEYGLMAPNVWGEVIRPLLTDRQGWALFIGTPNGKNEFYEISQRAQREPGWFFAAYKASETRILPSAELADARASMTADEYAQEFECSFEAAVKGAIFAGELQVAREEGRITQVPYDPQLPVDTDWDIGVDDHTGVWCSQALYSGEVRVIDYLEGSGQGLPYYASLLKAKPYVYGMHHFPFDIQVREFTTGRSRLETARNLLTNVSIPQGRTSLDDGISAARMFFRQCWFDADRCRVGLERLQHYKWKAQSADPTGRVLPVHDDASHGADAFRGLAVRHFTPRRKRAFEPVDAYEQAERMRLRGRSERRPSMGANRGGW